MNFNFTMKGKPMGYSGTIKNVITNITTQNDIYVNITSTTRMHIYKEDLDKTWYIVACEVLKNKKFQQDQQQKLNNIQNQQNIQIIQKDFI